MRGATVLRAGTLTTVQDFGRPGYRHLGVSSSGPMDVRSYRLANLLVGNEEGAAALEMTLVGPALLWHQSVCLAFSGAEMRGVVRLPGGLECETRIGSPVQVPAGSVTDFGEAVRGCRGYLAVRGGFGGAMVMGSRAGQLRSGFPGYCGRQLQRGDELELCDDGGAGGVGGKCGAEFVQAEWFVRVADLPPGGSQPQVLRCLPGRHLDLLDSASRDRFWAGPFGLSADCDRMGYRLTGAELSLASAVQIRSEAVVPGTLQLSPDGRLLLLMADCAATGGYPRVGHVISADLPVAGQLRPGDCVRFELVTMELAQRAVKEQERGMALVRLGLRRE
ncbi:MAG: biotin-dependent carboxyltransferase family protein [Planctomycetaceae bacterium]